MGILVDCSCTIPTAFDTDFALLENVTANAAITKRDPRAVLDALFILAPPIGFPDSSGGGGTMLSSILGAGSGSVTTGCRDE